MVTEMDKNNEDMVNEIERVLSLQGKCCTYGNIDFHDCEHIKSYWGEALTKAEKELSENHGLKSALFAASGQDGVDALERIIHDLKAVYTVQKCLVFRINDLITQAHAAIEKARKES